MKNVPREKICDGNIEKIKMAQKVLKTVLPYIFLIRRRTTVNVKHKWDEKISIETVQNKWEQYTMIPHNVTMNTKLMFPIQKFT